MEIELINQDISNYLGKYTRFMSKKVYITKKMYDMFVSSYDYIYKVADDSIINYSNDKNYKKLLEIKDKGIYALKLHNKKYLNDLYKNYGNMFSDELSKKDKMAILCEEDIVLVESKKVSNTVLLIKEKINYLNKILGNDSVCVISDDKFISNLDDGYDVYSFNSFGKYVCGYDKKVVLDLEKYDILSYYIKEILYKDKDKFKKFYDIFNDKLYFNKDCLNFETFKDYHFYMFKRRYDNSKKNLDDFVLSLILNRRSDLRSIRGEKYDDLFLVDIANCLFESGVDYKFIDNLFVINNLDNVFKIVFVDSECDNLESEDTIYLYSKYSDGSSYIDNLLWFLENKGFVLNKRNSEYIYNFIYEDMTDSYFVRFIESIIIPFINTILDNNYSGDEILNILSGLDGKILSEALVLLDFYNYYVSYLENNDWVDKRTFVLEIYNNISKISYKNLIVVGDSFIDFERFKDKAKVLIIKDKIMLSNSYMSSCIKSFYDFSLYLNNNKLIPINSVYFGMSEIKKISCDYLSSFDFSDVSALDKNINIYEYDDSNRLKSDIRCNCLINYVIGNVLDKGNVTIIGRDYHDMNLLTIGNYFYRGKKNKIICNCNNNISIKYVSMDCDGGFVNSSLILIHPIDSFYGFKYDYRKEKVISSFNKNDNKKNYDWERKLFLTAVSRVKKDLYVVVPKSGLEEFISNICLGFNVIVNKIDEKDILV